MTPRAICILVAAACFLGCGCQPRNTTSENESPALTPPEIAAVANKLFLEQPKFDPWILSTTDPKHSVDIYMGDGVQGELFDVNGFPYQLIEAGKYQNGHLQATKLATGTNVSTINPQTFRESLNLRTGEITASATPFRTQLEPLPGEKGSHNWPKIWGTSDIVIDGDPEAQQVTHANIFYLLSSTYPGSDHSIPPMGLSSLTYQGHIFWDAEIWMLPALIVQHPDYAKSIVDYRFRRLDQAKKNAKAHGFAGAEYPWESADTGKEEAPAEFAQERHITADVAFAAWQYYLWTGDKNYLKTEAWPILEATAQYWTSRVSKGSDGKYHITKVLSPDETAGVVDDDAYTNAVVCYNLKAAAAAAPLAGQAADPKWAKIATNLYFPMDKTNGIPAEHAGVLGDRFQAKQADTLLLIHPLGVTFDAATEGKMLDFYTAHTMKAGPAMTSSIYAIVAAQLGRGQQSLDLFHDAYRPFMRGPWDAFSEKRTTNNVYFITGMAGCLQSILYGFAGLHVVTQGEHAVGAKIAGDNIASLYTDPHLPPGWAGLTIKGIRFHGKVFNLSVSPDNRVAVVR